VSVIVKDFESTARGDMKSRAVPPYPGPDCQAGLAEKLLFFKKNPISLAIAGSTYFQISFPWIS